MYLAVHMVEGFDEVPGFRGRGARHVRRLLTLRRGFEGGNDVGDRTSHGVFEEQVAGGGQDDGDERNQPQGAGQLVAMPVTEVMSVTEALSSSPRSTFRSTHRRENSGLIESRSSGTSARQRSEL